MEEKTILITPRGYANHGEQFAEEFIKRGYKTYINRTGKQYSREEFLSLAKNASGIIVGVEEIDRELIDHATNLKAVVKFGVGTDNIDLEYAKLKNIKIGRCVGSNTNAVAEATIALMLMSAKHILKSALSVRDGEWLKISGIELKNKRLGIIGFGHIGQTVAKMAKAFDMEIFAYDEYPVDSNIIERLDVQLSSKEDIYRTCDFITLHVPLTDVTINMINDDQFNMMKPSCVLINTARGGVVNEKSLYHALKQKKILAAGFDVFTSEPPEDTDWVQELLHMDNFILLSHIAARTAEAEINTAKIATEKMIELLEGN